MPPVNGSNAIACTPRPLGAVVGDNSVQFEPSKDHVSVGSAKVESMPPNSTTLPAPSSAIRWSARADGEVDGCACCQLFDVSRIHVSARKVFPEATPPKRTTSLVGSSASANSPIAGGVVPPQVTLFQFDPSNSIKLPSEGSHPMAMPLRVKKK